MEELGTPGGAEDTWGSWGPPGELAPPGSLGIIWGPLWPGGHALWSPVPHPTQGTLPLPAGFPPKQSKHPEHRGWKQVPGPGGAGGGRGTPPHHLLHCCGAQPAATSAQVGLGVPRSTAEGPPITPYTPPSCSFPIAKPPPPRQPCAPLPCPRSTEGLAAKGCCWGGRGGEGRGLVPLRGVAVTQRALFFAGEGDRHPEGTVQGEGLPGEARAGPSCRQSPGS